MILKGLALIIFILGFLYIISPQPTSINQFPSLPDSLKSDEPGDTVQTPNIAAYFSNIRRQEVTDFYKKEFENLHFWGFTIPAIKLNHPPEEAFSSIRDQQRSTYLEEYVYPFKDSLFVNGYEPYDINGKAFDDRSAYIYVKDTYFDTKTTIRFYPSNMFMRIGIYLATWGLIILLFLLIKRIIKGKN